MHFSSLTWGIALLKGLCFSPVGASSYASIDTIPDPSSLHLFARAGIEDCRILVSTNIWTTCQSFITKYKITLPNFFKINPSVLNDCRGFKPGSSYCLRMPFVSPISQDGVCGKQSPEKVTCVGSTQGDCCGASGNCGSTDEFCAIGNCQDGNCPGYGYSVDGKCGSQNGGYLCGGSWGNCCSKAGVCGSTAAECGSGTCQSGDCTGISSTTSSTVVPSPTPLPAPFSPSRDGTCGYVNKYKCTNTTVYYGYCCSAAGYCGLTPYHCDNLQGCQSEYGLCDKTVIVTVTATPVPTPA